MRKILFTAIAVFVMFCCAATVSMAQEAPWETVNVSFSPRSLNLGSNGRWVTCKISDLPEGYIPADIDLDTVCIVNVNGTVLEENGGSICAKDSGGKHNNRGKKKLKVKFDQKDLADAIAANPGEDPSTAVITVEGSGLDDVLQFSGEDTIKVKPAKIKDKDKSPVASEYTVVCDPDTSLCWQDPQREAYNYTDQGMRAFEADQYCEELILGGFEDWRVPTISEIRSITAGFPGTETGGACPVIDGNITYAEAQFSMSCFNLDNELTGKGPGDNGCYFKPGFTGTCDKYDPYGGHPLEHVAFEEPSDEDIWRAVLMFENGSVLFNHQCTLVDVRCVRDDDNSPIVECADSKSCKPGKIKSCECVGFGDRPDGIQTCSEAGDCWGPCECTQSVIDTSVDPECHAGNDLYDSADILTVIMSVPDGASIDYDPADLQAFLYRCPDDTAPMPQSPPDGGSWENLVSNPGLPPYSMEVRGISYYRESLIADGRYCLLVMLNQLHRMPPIPLSGDYTYWHPDQGIVFPLEGGAQTVEIILDRVTVDIPLDNVMTPPF